MQKTLKIILILICLASPFQALAWRGYDFENKADIEIGDGNLVREGLIIQFYDNQSDNFHTAKVIFLEGMAGGTRLQVFDEDLQKERTFIMEN
jgi:hypothetical protein